MLKTNRREASPTTTSGSRRWSGDDATLVELIRAGHEEAPRWLHDRFAREIDTVVFRILGGDADHEDLVHEIFMRIWILIGKGKVREPTRLGPWVFSVATHMLHNELRRRYVRRKFLRKRETAPAAVLSMREEDSRHLLLAVYRILADMPPAERLVFGLRYIDQRSLVDLAPMCGISLSTAKRRLVKAERTFARLVPSHGDYPALKNLVATIRGEEVG